MSKFKVGDRINFKHDSRWNGEIILIQDGKYFVKYDEYDARFEEKKVIDNNCILEKGNKNAKHTN